MNGSASGTARVWDPLVRVAHWLLVVAFAVAYLSEGEPRIVHTVAGYVVGAYVLVRVLWGFVGSPYARFASFSSSPADAVRYLVALVRRRAPRHLGHSPAGGIMVLLLLASLAATTVAGLMLYAVHDGAGPPAWLPIRPRPSSCRTVGTNRRARSSGRSCTRCSRTSR
jgi:cytochrome b